MMRFPRSIEPAGFSARVSNHRAAIATEVANGSKPNFDGRGSWREFKPQLSAATFGKCAFCEVDVMAGDRFKGDVEHFRPKGRVDRLTVNRDGSVESGRQFDSGYHWLAYEWSNYLLACGQCNSGHKRNFFPLDPEPVAAPSPGRVQNEKPLTLHPFARKDPTKHLLFDHLGIVGPRRSSRFGRHTIEVCGLSRTALEKKRRRTAEIVQIQLDVLAQSGASQDAIDGALRTLAAQGAIDQEHCGMVRAMFQEATDLPWSFVEQSAPRPTPVFSTDN